VTMPSEPTVTLDNCDREPIHTPGAIQSHGVLLAFDATGVLRQASANAAALLAPCTLPALGAALQPEHFGAEPAVHALLAESLATLAQPDALMPLAQELRVGEQLFDVVPHRSAEGLLIVEFELQPMSAGQLTSFSLMAHRAMDKLKRLNSIDGLLAAAVTEVRQLTGFDRVMGYRFRHDDSGDVVAEARTEALEPFLGRRYPASDIPAQARRLYVVNTLRLIADVTTTPVPVQALAPDLLDMSGAILRAVSPIHIEYLRNMGVAASMSISIVVDGRLWGLLACHHYAPRRVPYALRMACDVVGQLLASRVQTLLAGQRADELRTAAALSTRIAEQVLQADDTLSALAAEAPALCQLLHAGAVVIGESGKVRAHGVDGAAAEALLRWLSDRSTAVSLQAARSDVLHGHDAAQMPAALRARLAPLCGVLALRFDAAADGWVVLLRPEQIETIHWGGRPVKEYTPGPLGPRLTPRGSFDLWKETVRGQAVPWTLLELDLAAQLLDGLVRAHAAKLAETIRLRTELLAMLGHDLRDPLQSITMAAHVLQRSPSGDGRGGELGTRIRNSSGRMQRLITQVLDLSRVKSGSGLQLDRRPTDLVALARDLIAEMRLAHPARVVDFDAPPLLMADVDADRLAQVISNLLSNARHHGDQAQPIAVRLYNDSDALRLRVANAAQPIDPAFVPMLFDPFKRAANRERNRSGLGLGLYLAQQMTQGHGGTLAYAYEDGLVVFTVVLPKPKG